MCRWGVVLSDDGACCHGLRSDDVVEEVTRGKLWMEEKSNQYHVLYDCLVVVHVSPRRMRQLLNCVCASANISDAHITTPHYLAPAPPVQLLTTTRRMDSGSAHVGCKEEAPCQQDGRKFNPAKVELALNSGFGARSKATRTDSRV